MCSSFYFMVSAFGITACSGLLLRFHINSVSQKISIDQFLSKQTIIKKFHFSIFGLVSLFIKKNQIDDNIDI